MGVNSSLVDCINGHSNHVSRSICLVCGEPLIGDWDSRQRVYVIGEQDSAGEVHRVKIGMSIDPWARLKDLQTGSPRSLALLATGPGGRVLEGRLHRVLQDHHAHGEWFDLDAVTLQSVCAVVRDARREFGTAPLAAPPPMQRQRVTFGQLARSATPLPGPWWAKTVAGFVIVALLVQFALAVAALGALTVAYRVGKPGWFSRWPSWTRFGMAVGAFGLVAAQVSLGPLLDADEPSPSIEADADVYEPPTQRRSPPTVSDCPDWSANC